MAFTTSNLTYSPLGVRSCVQGDWTGNIGDAAGTLQLAGGRVYEANFETQATSPGGPTANKVPVGISINAPYITLQIYNHEDVTAGRFQVIYG